MFLMNAAPSIKLPEAKKLSENFLNKLTLSDVTNDSPSIFKRKAFIESFSNLIKPMLN